MGSPVELNQNLVNVQWGLLSVAGVIITLLIPRATDYYQQYLATGADEPHDQAARWVRVIRWTPLVVLIALIGLSMLGARDVDLAARHPVTRETALWLLLTPLLAQAAFALLVCRLVPPVLPIRALPLQTVPNEGVQALASPMGNTPRSVLRFVNLTDRALRVRWIAFDGGLRGPGLSVEPRAEAESSGEATQETYEGHRFLVTDDAAGALPIGYVVAQKLPSKVLLRD
jgi:hypothetical protein